MYADHTKKRGGCCDVDGAYNKFIKLLSPYKIAYIYRKLKSRYIHSRGGDKPKCSNSVWTIKCFAAPGKR